MSPRPVDPDDRQGAMRTAIRLIEHHDRTEADLRMRLASRGYGSSTIDAVLERLLAGGFVNDRRFAERFAELAADGRGMGSRRIKMELQRRGVPKEMAIETGLTAAASDRDRALELASRRAERLRDLPRDVAYRRLAGFLARKGYGPDVCVEVTRSVLAGGPMDSSTDE